MLDPQQILWFVIGPALQWIELDSIAARALLIGTALTESGLKKLSQGNDRSAGPGLGLYQMEKATHDDIWENWIAPHDGEMHQKVQWLLPLNYQEDQLHLRLIDNLSYATVMCRLHYRRVTEPLPEATDIKALGAYWKRHYNTEAGAGSASDFVQRASILPTLELS